MVDDLVYYTSVEEYVKLKIKRNHIMKECLDLKNTILQKEILFNHKNILVNKQKIAIIDEINCIEAKQATRFVPELEEILVDKYKQVNNLQVDDYDIIKADIVKNHGTFSEKVNEVIELNEQIPKKIDYVNIGYKLSAPGQLE